MIWSIGRVRRKVVSRCQTANKSRRIFCRDIVCDVNMLSRAPEFKIGLVNDITIDISKYMPEMDMMICEP